jgi:hypothetical protein
MKIDNIILVQRDSGKEFYLKEMTEMANCSILCRLEEIGVSVPIAITLSLLCILNALNNPCGAWSLKLSDEQYNFDNIVYIKGEFIEKEETENGFNLIKVMDGGTRPQELYIKNNRYNQARIRNLK